MYDLLVVGAGPYGLSIAAHAAAAGLDVRVFGRPMAAWRDHMPEGMFLKSEPWASHLSDPGRRYGLDAYGAERGVPTEHAVPLPVRTFAEYGLWFAQRAVPRVDERMIRTVDTCTGGFRALTEDGEPFHARSVALAVGVLPFVDVPGPLRGLGPEYVTHSSHHGDLTRFRDADVTVIGAGQAALETAALLAEQGTRVRVLARSHTLNWNGLPPAWRRPWWDSVRAPHSGLGCGWRNWCYAELPGAFRRLPESGRTRIAATALGPAGAWWLRDRFEPSVEVLPGHEAVRAGVRDGRVRLEVRGPAGAPVPLLTDHVIAATGFRAGRDRLRMLSPDLRASLMPLADGSPDVGRDFESSWPGLFLAGLVTASGFGPAMRFVHGASYTAGRLVRGVRRHVRHQSRTPVRPPRLPSPASPAPDRARTP
ncbi:NAD(P)-binding domain-containing protein [Streptomyces sp. SID4919]|uniref:NAD(P)-binding domain-containing protein n=1 Tax=Streptomyces TaxID=1883 RepID=UPI000823AB43|nr:MULTISPECIES: NAD(P)-binding domain-containing protein [Streptomyces]MYY10167.1 NAD(P)-binding domain-containing protein [Streptomyces sp. SID4919]SCK51104.1 Lysine/ornithine N-monooxygenase [Streptomyces sp. AmelKG-E11A]